MTDKTNLVLLFGGRSGEHAVSLMSARSVLGAIDTHKYNVYQVGITQEGEWLTGENVLKVFEDGQLGSLKPALLSNEYGNIVLNERHDNKLHKVGYVDVVFPLLHGTFGEDGTMQGLLEILDVAYVGAGVLGSAIAMDKGVAKHLIEAEGIPVLEYQIFTRLQICEHMDSVIHQAEQVAPYPLFVKPCNLGSSVGISKVLDRAGLVAALLKAAKYDRRILVERGLDKAREIEVSVLGNDETIASLPGEIIPDDIFYTYDDKYFNGEAELCIPAALTGTQTNTIQKLANEAYKALDGAGMARVDFLIDRKTEAIYFNEINTIPGFTNISMYPKLWKVCGLDYPDLIDRLIQLGLERKQDRDATVRKFED